MFEPISIAFEAWSRARLDEEEIGHLRRAKLRIIDAIPVPTQPASADAFVQSVLLPRCRALELDAREAFAVHGLDLETLVGTVTRPCTISSWVEQKAVRRALKFLRSSEQQETAKSAIEALTQHAAKHLAPHIVEVAAVSATDATTDFLDRVAAVSHKSLDGSSNVVVVKDAAGLGNGSLVVRGSVPAFTPVLTIPGRKLFNLDTIRRYCDLGMVLARASWKKQLDDAGEAALLACLVYERAKWRSGSGQSHWAELLETCPSSFPYVPTLWSPLELRELSGTSLLDEVSQKQQSLEEFVSSMQDLLAQVAEAHSPIFDALVNNDASASPRPDQLRTVFSREAFEWARCVFDSRSFQLQAGGRTLVTMAPVADMINHVVHGTHILSRRIDNETGDFILESSMSIEATPSAPVELVMSYGPLQSWELLLSYGFVPAGDNEHDRLPFESLRQLINVDQPASPTFDDATALPKPTDEEPTVQTGVPALDCSGEDPTVQVDEEAGDDGYDILRRRIIETHGLDLVDQLYIPVSGVAPPVVRAVLRLCQAEAEDFTNLSRDVFADGPDYLEDRVSDTLIQFARSVIVELEGDTAAEGDDGSGNDDKDPSRDSEDGDVTDAAAGEVSEAVSARRRELARDIRTRVIAIARRVIEHEESRKLSR
jgi:hypothetical protein